jgi:hypothetical protein
MKEPVKHAENYTVKKSPLMIIFSKREIKSEV